MVMPRFDRRHYERFAATLDQQPDRSAEPPDHDLFPLVGLANRITMLAAAAPDADPVFRDDLRAVLLAAAPRDLPRQPTPSGRQHHERADKRGQRDRRGGWMRAAVLFVVFGGVGVISGVVSLMGC